MFEYVNTKGDLDIATSAKPVKREVVEQRADFTHIKFEYPNDWLIEVKHYSDKVIFLSNVELEKKEDGKLHPKY